MKRHPTQRRRALSLVEVIIVIVAIAVLIGLLLPGLGKVYDDNGRGYSQCNLKDIGLAMANYAQANNGMLPRLGPNFFSDKLPSAGVKPTEGLITFMKNDFKTFQAPLDPNAFSVGNRTDALSYALPGSWDERTYHGGMHIPATFVFRGTSNCVGCAEVTCGAGGTKLVSGTYLLYNHDRGPDPFRTPAGPWNGNASMFYSPGCQLVMMDGSVRTVRPKQAADFILCSDPRNKEEPSEHWEPPGQGR